MENNSSTEGKTRTHEPFEPESFDDGISGEDLMGEERNRKEGDALSEVDRVLREGYEEGYRKGVADGEKEVEERKRRLEEILKEIDRYRESKFNDLFPAIIDLSIEIASKVVHREIKSDRETIVHVAKDALKKLSEGEENITIRVNPEDYEVIFANLHVMKDVKDLRNIEVEPNPSITPGGCYIETASGEIDGRIEEQLDEIANVLRKTNGQ